MSDLVTPAQRIKGSREQKKTRNQKYMRKKLSRFEISHV